MWIIYPMLVAVQIEGFFFYIPCAVYTIDGRLWDRPVIRARQELIVQQNLA